MAAVRQWNAVAAGVVVTILFHCALVTLLLTAGFSGPGIAAVAKNVPGARRRPPAAQVASFDRRTSEGFQPRLQALLENGFSRRGHISSPGRRPDLPLAQRPLRFIEVARGRKAEARPLAMKVRSIDYGTSELTPLTAMLVPRLGMKKEDKNQLPRLTKYEQPEKVEDGINISKVNPDGTPLQFKELDPKQAQLDRKRKKKPSLDDLIDAPDDDDPRKRPQMLESIIGSPDGETWGTGSEARAGDIYLAKVENSLRQEFRVPVFLSKDDLKKLVVEVEIRQMDASGRVVSYAMRRKSGSSAFDSAAIEAIKRFVAEEGGSRSMPAPDPAMLQNINKRGILVRLEGKKIQ
jgi:hypothetical protein